MIFRSSLLPSSIQLLRCTAEAVQGQLGRSSSESAGRWAPGGAHGSGDRGSGGDEAHPVNIETEGGCPRLVTSEGGGDEETRTPDPLLAKEMLCQLSYVPEHPVDWEWWAHLDSNQGPRPYQGRALTS